MEIKEIKKQEKKTRSQKQNGFLMLPHPLTNFEIQNIMKINLDLMVFIQEIIYKKQRMGHMK